MLTTAALKPFYEKFLGIFDKNDSVRRGDNKRENTFPRRFVFSSDENKYFLFLLRNVRLT